MGIAHSAEAWLDGELVGGLYGFRLGSYFTGESQFHTVPDAGKVAFAAMLERLKDLGYMLHDIQYRTPHLDRFGAINISDAEFRVTLTKAMITPAEWPAYSEKQG